MNINKQMGTFRSLLSGSILSFLLTMGAFIIVQNQLLTGIKAYLSVSLLIFAQAICVLFFFLQLGKESKPRWNLALFFFMVMVLVILIVGSLWIMHHLDYNLMGM